MRGTSCTQNLTRGEKVVLGRVPLPGTYVLPYSVSSDGANWTVAKCHRAGTAFSSTPIPVNLLEEQAGAADQAVWGLKPDEIGTVRLRTQ